MRLRMRMLWKPAAAAVLFILVMFFVMSRKSKDGFQNFNWMQFIQQLKQAAGQQEQIGKYDQWIGYLYKYPTDSAKSLNDFKSRAFQPNCRFRMDWNTNLPQGLLRPTAAKNGAEANLAYRGFLDCLGNGTQDCLLKLDDVRKRFMEPGCNFLNPSDPRTYSRNYQAVFKDKP
jgi:hypothetical protein